MNNKEINNYLKIVVIAVIVIGGGLFIINQFFSWHYKAQLLMKPCDLCISLNPDFTRCNVEIVRVTEEQIKNINWDDYLPTENFTS